MTVSVDLLNGMLVSALDGRHSFSSRCRRPRALCDPIATTTSKHCSQRGPSSLVPLSVGEGDLEVCGTVTQTYVRRMWGRFRRGVIWGSPTQGRSRSPSGMEREGKCWSPMSCCGGQMTSHARRMAACAWSRRSHVVGHWDPYRPFKYFAPFPAWFDEVWEGLGMEKGDLAKVKR